MLFLQDIRGQADYMVTETHSVVLSIISTVGLSISIAALTLHLLSFIFIM